MSAKAPAPEKSKPEPAKKEQTGIFGFISGTTDFIISSPTKLVTNIGEGIAEPTRHLTKQVTNLVSATDANGSAAKKRQVEKVEKEDREEKEEKEKAAATVVQSGLRGMKARTEATARKSQKITKQRSIDVEEKFGIACDPTPAPAVSPTSADATPLGNWDQSKKGGFVGSSLLLVSALALLCGLVYGQLYPDAALEWTQTLMGDIPSSSDAATPAS